MTFGGVNRGVDIAMVETEVAGEDNVGRGARKGMKECMQGFRGEGQGVEGGKRKIRDN